MSYNEVNQTTGELQQVAGSQINSIYADAPLGAILSYGGDVAPTGWLLCDGSAVSRTTYAQLFEVIGTKYGPGDGSTTFNLPNGVSGAELYPVGDAGSGISGSVYIIKAVHTQLPVDFQTAVDEKQDIVDDTLETTSKEIVGAINELNYNLTVTYYNGKLYQRLPDGTRGAEIQMGNAIVNHTDVKLNNFWGATGNNTTPGYYSTKNFRIDSSSDLQYRYGETWRYTPNYLAFTNTTAANSWDGGSPAKSYNNNSCWESKTGFSDEYLAVDLYKPKKVKYVTFVSPIWVENQSNSYKIKLQYSDDKSEWNDASELITFYIPTVATGKFDVYIPSNEEDSHRYWRLNFTEPSSTSLSAVVSGCAFMGDE